MRLIGWEFLFTRWKCYQVRKFGIQTIKNRFTFMCDICIRVKGSTRRLYLKTYRCTFSPFREKNIFVFLFVVRWKNKHLKRMSNYPTYITLWTGSRCSAEHKPIVRKCIWWQDAWEMQVYESSFYSQYLD